MSEIHEAPYAPIRSAQSASVISTKKGLTRFAAVRGWKLNVAGYLERIGYHGPLQPSLEVLQKLHQRHLLSVPFENLDIHMGRPIGLSEAAFYTKIVENHRGGFCYELNGAFAMLLKALGFRVSMLSARPHRRTGGFFPEFDHMTLAVRLKDTWLADVGFGDCFEKPLRIKESTPQEENGGIFLISSQRHVRLLSQWDSDYEYWKPWYLFQSRPRRLEEFVPRCNYQQTSPRSSFRKNRLCTILTNDGRVTLTDNALIVRKGVKRYERRVNSQAEFIALLGEKFGIDLT